MDFIISAQPDLDWIW